MCKEALLRTLIFLIISLPFLLIASVIAAQDVALQASQTDAVYLLDVTSSMVGDGWKQCDRSKDILNQVLDLLLTEIERFSNGRLILITFAMGPYDLDEAGPIQGMYSIEIKGNADKLILKQFIRPKEYGAPAEAPSWPGIYETVYSRTCIEGRNIGGTAIYDTILLALQELEKLQTNYPGGKEAYAASHTQEIVVFTDGEDNASKNSFDKVLAQLKAHYFQMQGQFHYKRYLFSKEPEGIKQAEDECTKIEREGAAGYVQNVVAPDITQLVIIDFDRHILGFPNVWAPIPPEDSRTVTLKNIQLYYDRAKANLLEGGRLVIQPVKADDLGLPGDVAVKVKAEPADLKFPLEQFDLQITLEPFSRLKAFMQRDNKDGLRGLLRFTFVKDTQTTDTPVAQERACKITGHKEPLVDLKQSSIPVDLPYVRPALQVEWGVEHGEAFALTLVPNEVFQALHAKEQQVRVDYNEKYFTLTDDQGQTHKSSEPFSLNGIRKLVLHLREELTSGAYKDSVRLTPELSEVHINKASAFERSYEFWVLGFDREKLVFPDLYAEQPDQGDVHTITAELQLLGGPPHGGQIIIQPVGFNSLKEAGLGIDVEPKALGPPFDQRIVQLSLKVLHYTLLAKNKDLQEQLNRDSADGHLFFKFNASNENQLIKVKMPTLSGLPVDLKWCFSNVMIAPDRLVFRDQATLSLKLEASECFKGGSVRIEYDARRLLLTDESGQKLTEITLERPRELALIALASTESYEGKIRIALQNARINDQEPGLLEIPYEIPPAPVEFAGVLKRGDSISLLLASKQSLVRVICDPKVFIVKATKGEYECNQTLSGSNFSLIVKPDVERGKYKGCVTLAVPGNSIRHVYQFSILPRWTEITDSTLFWVAVILGIVTVLGWLVPVLAYSAFIERVNPIEQVLIWKEELGLWFVIVPAALGGTAVLAALLRPAIQAIAASFIPEIALGC